MKMNSTNTKKRSRKVIVSRRHIRSTSSRSLSLLNLGNSKRRIAVLLKSNKSLALALQDARCELSAKQKHLENAAKRFKNILEARVLMLEMHSNLKAFVKKFEDVLPLLNVDGIKISDLIVPFKSCRQFKSKIKNLAESVEEVREENSFSAVAEEVDSDIDMIQSPNQTISCDHNPSVGIEAIEVTNRCVGEIRTNFESEQGVQVSSENTSTFNSKNTADVLNSRPSVKFCKKFGEAVNPSIEKQTSQTKSDTLKNRESSGTPKLSITSVNTLDNSEVPSNSRICVSFKIPSSHSEKILSKPVSSSIMMTSKIPRLHNVSLAAKMVSNVLGKVCKYPKTAHETSVNVSEDSDLGVVRRKTFVVENSDTSAVNSQSNDTLNKNEISNENDFPIEELGKTNCRKTFVIKNVDITEDTGLSISSRRKTFVKKSTHTKIRKSVRNRRGTFVISDNKEDCNDNENKADATEASSFNDIVKENCLLLCEKKIADELPCDEMQEIDKNAFQDNLVSMDISPSSKILSLKHQTEQIPPQDTDNVTKTNKTTLESGEFELDNCSNNGVKGNLNQTEQIPSQDTDNVTKTNKTTLESGEFKLDNCSNNGVKGNLCKAKNVDIKPSTSEIVQSSNICVTSQKFAEPVTGSALSDVASDEDTEILGGNKNTRFSRPRKSVSYKVFLDSSSSDLETISDLDCEFIKEPPVKSVPIRKKISVSRKKKVFVFGKKSVDKVNKKSLKHPDFMKECNSASQVDSTNIQNEVIAKLSEGQQKKKFKKCISYDSTVNVSNNNGSNSYSKAPYTEQEILQSVVTDGKDTKISESVHFEELKIQEELSVSKSPENIKTSASHFNSPVIALHNFLNTIDCESENIDCEEEQSNMICNSKTKPNKGNKKAGKKKEAKIDHLKNSSDVGISVKKRAKRNNSKKQPEEIITSDVGEGNKSNIPLKNKNQRNETGKKNKTKYMSKNKSPPNVPNGNIIVVQADVHAPPLQSCTISETGHFNKENTGNEDCFVVLNDIFQRTNIDRLTLSCKDKVVSKDRNIPLKLPLSDNSSNLLTSVGDDHNCKFEGSTTNDVQDIRPSTRRKRINYKEPSLMKKMRQ